MRVGGQRYAPAALPPGKTRYPLYWRLGGPQGRSGQVRKISPPPGFDPRTVQPVGSRCTDWAIRAHKYTRRNIPKDPNLQHRLRENAEPRKLTMHSTFFYIWVSVHHKSIIYNKPTRCNSGSIVFINNYKYALHIKYQNDIRWVSQNTTLYYGVRCQKIDNMFRPFSIRPSSGLTWYT